MKYISFFQKTFLGLAALAMLSLTAVADFTPQSPAFPHGSGITRAAGGCTAADNGCSSGLNFPSFNNFTDSVVNGSSVIGVTDERRFTVAQNLGPDGTNTSNPYADSVSASVGDLIYVRSYIHNNGHINDASTTATNTTIGISGFVDTGNNYYHTAAGTSVTLNQFTSSSNATPNTVTDDVTVTSSDGSPIKLMYYDQTGAVQTAASISGTLHSIDTTDFISGGANIGDVKGCSAESFYTWTVFRVVDGSDPEYNLNIEKTVGTTAVGAINKSMTVAPGDLVYYKLFYTNELSSTATPIGTKIYDDFDETKLEIVWLQNSPKVCEEKTVAGNQIIECDAYDLAPVAGVNEHTFYYIARVKAGVTGTIPNTVEIRPNIDNDTNSADDFSSAVLTVVTNGICGDGATTYASDVNAYPAGTEFCAEGTAVPSSPAFPAAGQTVTWTCEGINGGTNSSCSATKVINNEYDLTIDKYVGTSTEDANLLQKLVSSSIGSNVTYRIDYSNLSASTATPSGTKIYDNYDETKLDIIWTAPNCSDTNGMIICDGSDLAPGEARTVYYVAIVKAGATSPIDNTVEIVPDNNDNPNDNTGGPLNKNPNDLDINDSNDYSSAQVVLQTVTNGVCGDGSTTYGADVISYPSGTKFCAENGGTAVPANPAFPAAGQTVNWTCEGANGGTNTQCSATKAMPQTYDLTINKRVGGDANGAMEKQYTSAIGQGVTYRLDYENLSSSTATPTGTKIYDDYDQTKLEITLLDPRCTDNGDVITCNAADLAPGATHTIYYNAIIKSGATSPIDNIVEIVPDNDTNQGNNTGTVESCTNNGDLNTNPNDLDINDCNDTSTAQVLLITAINGVCGDGAMTYANDVTAYPSGTVFCSGGTAVPAQPAFPASGQTVTWTCQGANGGTNTTCEATRSSETPVDVTILKSVTPTQAKAGDMVTYTLKYQNLTAGTTAKEVTIQDIIPGTHIDLDSIVFTPPTGVVCSVTQSDDPLVVVIQGRYIECTEGNLSASEGEKTITYTARIKSTVATGTNIDNVAKIKTTSPETDSTNNRDIARVTVIETVTGYDLTIDKKVDGVKNKTVTPGQVLTYTLTYRNLTPGTTAKDVRIYDVFDSEHVDMRSIAFQNPLPAGVTCVVTSDDDPLRYILDGEFIRCTMGDLSYDDGEQTITYTIKVNDTAPTGTVIGNTAEILPNPDDDTNPNNDKSSASVTVNAPADNYDLTIDKKVDGLKTKTVAAGSTVTFTLDYKNLDSSANTATDVKLIDDYDETKLNIIASSLPAGCSDSAGVVTCSIGSLTVGQVGSIEFQARLLEAFTAGETINSVEIKPTVDQDTNPNNDVSTATVIIQTGGTSVNGQCGAGSKAYPHTTTAYPSGTVFCTVGNATPVTPAFPAVNQAVTWTCSGSNGGTTATCNATRPYTTTNPTTPTPAPTTVTTSTGGGNNGGSGGGCSTYSTIDLNIAKYIKLDNGSFVAASSRTAAVQLAKNTSNSVVYKIVVSNAGDVGAYNIKVKDTFSSSDGLTQSNIQTLSGATYSNGLFEFINAVPANGSREFTYSASITAGSGGIGTNTARIESMEQSYTCPKIASAKGVGRTSVAYVKAGAVASAGYVLDKIVDKQVVKAGDEVNYTLSIKNTGNVDMKNVILVDKFPSEYLVPAEHFTAKLVNNRTLEFKRKFLPVGDTFSVQVKMIVREGVPKGTEIKNMLTGRSDTIDINDSATTTVIVGESNEAAPTCPSGYEWKGDLNTCKRKWIPRTPQSGLELPLLPIGITLLGLAMIMRREDIAKMIG